MVIPTQGGAEHGGAGQSDADEDPPDEPAPQQVSAADAARVGQMTTEVLVVDGRPRYHLAGCVHLLGRDHEPIPVVGGDQPRIHSVQPVRAGQRAARRRPPGLRPLPAV